MPFQKGLFIPSFCRFAVFIQGKSPGLNRNEIEDNKKIFLEFEIRIRILLHIILRIRYEYDYDYEFEIANPVPT